MKITLRVVTLIVLLGSAVAAFAQAPVPKPMGEPTPTGGSISVQVQSR